MIKIVLLRHGQSTWNEENRFTGWTDVDLSGRGPGEALEAGRLLKSHEYSFDCAYTALLKRAIRTLWFVLDELDLMWIPSNAQCQRGPDTLPFTGRKDSAEATLSIADALRCCSIRSLIAAQSNPETRDIIQEIVTRRNSNFLLTDFIL